MADDEWKCRFCGITEGDWVRMAHFQGFSQCLSLDRCRDRCAQQLKDAKAEIANLEWDIDQRDESGQAMIERDESLLAKLKSKNTEIAALREMLYGVTSELEVCLPILPNTPIGQETYQRIADKIDEAQILLNPQAPSEEPAPPEAAGEREGE